MNRTAFISIDVDTLASIYKGSGCVRNGGYTYAEMEIGMENLVSFFKQYECPTTLFLVGNDLKVNKNIGSLKAALEVGHEAANHSMTHPQGFRYLSKEEKQAELSQMSAICDEKLSVKPLGFRAPGWNSAGDSISLLKDLGYTYDSSVFPTYFMPILKFSHWVSMRGRHGSDRTTMGSMGNMLAPRQPYRTNLQDLHRKGSDGIWEIPVAVSPILRIPISATFLLLYGKHISKLLLNSMLRSPCLHFQFHLSDFVDFTHTEFEDQVPRGGSGVYVPRALTIPFKRKMAVFHWVMDLIAHTYAFQRIDQWVGEHDP